MLFHAGLSADITNLSFPLIFHTILDVSLSFPSPSLLCVLGRSTCEQGCWGNHTGTLSVSGKNIFTSFHMDGAWWACFNVPWVCGIVRLYSIFYYLMEKEVYFFIFWKKKTMKQNCLCVCVWWGVMEKNNLTQDRITPWNFSSVLDLYKLNGLILLVKLPFCIKKGQWKVTYFNCFFPLPQRKTSMGVMKSICFCGIAIDSISQ